MSALPTSALAALPVVGLAGAPWLRHRLVPARVPVDPEHHPRAHRVRRRRVRISARATRWLAPAAVGLLTHPAIGGALAVLVALLPTIARMRRQQRVRRAVDAALPDAIELLVLLVHGGLTPHQTIDVLANRGPPPIRPGFAAVRAGVHRGAPLADALRELPAVLGGGAAPVADALGMAVRQGLPLGPTLEQLALDARQRRRRLAEADARTLPVRLAFPLVVCTLPSFILVAIAPAVMAAISSLGDRAW